MDHKEATYISSIEGDMPKATMKQPLLSEKSGAIYTREKGVSFYSSDGSDSEKTTSFVEPNMGAESSDTFFSPRSRRDTFKAFRLASLSISMLEKPSDDRKAATILSGWNVSNLIQGTGILGIPYAVKQGGWFAVFLIFFVAILSCYTGKILVDSMYETSKKTNIKRRLRTNFPEIAEKVLGRKGYTMLTIFQIVELFGAVVMYLILLGSAWSDMLSSLTALGIKQWIAINALAVFPLIFITRMSIVSWLSMVAVLALMTTLLVLLGFCFTQTSVWNIFNIPPFDVETFPISFGVIVFSYASHAIFPSIEGSMKKPEEFNKMMNVSFFVAAIVKACLGTFMVLTYGDTTNQVATVNLGSSPTIQTISTSLVIINVMLAVPLCMFVVNLTIDEVFLIRMPNFQRVGSLRHWAWLLITRTSMLSVGLIIAVVVPQFALLMGFIGSFTGTCLCFLFPCYFHLKIRWETLKKWEIALEVFIICFGIIAGFLGMVFSGKALLKTIL